MKHTRFFQDFIPELESRSARGTLSRLGIASPSLRQHLRKEFEGRAGSSGALLAEPVFEAMFGWKAAPETMQDMVGSIIPSRLMEYLESPPTDRVGADYSFPRDRRPYLHQLQAWRELAKPPGRAITVTSGTGSGKTECFLIPILADLAAQVSDSMPLQGVQAIFLYPMNALIASQKDRLRAWTDGFGSQVRFGLYNGLMREAEKPIVTRQWPSEVMDRKTLRDSPPPILVTNSTMLEYMLIRASDAPILEKSQGKLRWIVLDEAHTYLGSQAAELALLLRRVMLAFGVTPADIKFVLTSATLGDDSKQSAQSLRQLIADLSGVGIENVVVVRGQREIPVLPSAMPHPLTTVEQLRSAFIQAHKHVLTWREIRQSMPTKAGDKAFTDEDLLARLDEATSDGAEAALPLRVHLFHRTLPGLWACADRTCPKRSAELSEESSWEFGQVYSMERLRCECGGPMFPVLRCEECGDTVLQARQTVRNGANWLSPALEDDEDEFMLDVDPAESDTGEAEPNAEHTIDVRVWIHARPGSDRTPCHLDPVTYELLDRRSKKTIEVILRAEFDGGKQTCSACGASAHAGRQIYRSFRLGVPFFLGQIIPTALEFSPESPDPLGSPFRGRRALAFADSRQGSARIAAKLQQDSERQRVRGLVVEALYSRSAASPSVVQAKTLELAELEAAKRALPGLSQSIIERARKELEALTRPVPFSHADVVKSLASSHDFETWISRYYGEMDTALGRDHQQLAEMAFAREFGRRPKRANNLETMGLVAITYPALERITSAPREFERLGGSVADWQCFLQQCLDFFLRENTVVDLPAAWRRWGGNRIGQKRVVGPRDPDIASTGFIKWPRCRGASRPPRIARLLAVALSLRFDNDADRDVVDELLVAAWDSLTSCQAIVSQGGTFLLPFRNVSLQLMTSGFICPVTRRFLSSAFFGLTPYLPSVVGEVTPYRCRQIAFPSCEPKQKVVEGESERVHQIRQWLNENPDIQTFRQEGLWPDLNDRVLEGVGFFRAAEHSAQQSRQRLETYERLFKESKLNLLSCSTTMEMGVDIGGIATVAMNNVPPAPANYMQRAGRAGRRGESRAIAVTLCKHNPHDYAVFAAPRWAFDTPTPVTRVSLTSEKIVFRHAHSLLLGRYLRRRAAIEGADALRLTCGWFFDTDTTSPADECIADAETLHDSQELRREFNVLLAGTGIEGEGAVGRVIDSFAEQLRLIATNWRRRLDAIESELLGFSSKADQASPAFRAITLARKRHTDEYLLSELANLGFLPGYGFPTGVVPFDNNTVEQFLKQKMEEIAGREDSRSRVRELPSRDIDVALREYAPGADVVIDGSVYRSAGITLNWHSPIDAEKAEAQQFSWAWRCDHCGEVGLSDQFDESANCAHCGTPISAEHRRQFLQPTGFAVDFYGEVHTDVSQQSYIPPKAPWVQAIGPWRPLANPALGKVRSSPDGVVFVHSGGAHGHGYALCLSCGRAEPMENQNENSSTIPKRMQDHRRLRGKDADGGRLCSGLDLVRPSVYLGATTLTDVCEIRLRDLLGAPISDVPTAFTLAVALRKSAAQAVGVEIEEFGCDIKPLRTEAGVVEQVIVIYDKHSAGYSSLVGERIEEVLRGAAVACKCPVSCQDGCQQCLLSFDIRFRTMDVKRDRALQLLSSEWLNNLSLPESFRVLGPASRLERRDLGTAINIEIERKATRIDVFAGGKISEIDFSASPLRSLLHRWASRGLNVRLVLDEAGFRDAPQDLRDALFVLTNVPGIEAWTAPSMILTGGFNFLVRVRRNNQSCAWVTRSLSMGIPSEGWGAQGEEEVVVGPEPGSDDRWKRIDSAALARASITAHGSTLVNVSTDLNGSTRQFGEQFWKLVSGKCYGLSERLGNTTSDLVEVAYSDRYVKAPLPAMLLLRVLTALKEILGARWRVTKTSLATTPCDPANHRRGNRIGDNWQDSKIRDAVVTEAFAIALSASVELSAKPPHEIPHARTLTLGFRKSGSSGATDIVRIWLDQGFGYWRSHEPGRGLTSRTDFNFSSGVVEQATHLRQVELSVRGQEFPTTIAATVERTDA